MAQERSFYMSGVSKMFFSFTFCSVFHIINETYGSSMAALASTDTYSDQKEKDNFSCERENCIAYHLWVRGLLQLKLWVLSVSVVGKNLMDNSK